MADVSVAFVGGSDQDGKDGPFYLTNTRGWVRFAEWIKGLSEELYPQLHSLAESGKVEDTLKLSLEIADVFDDNDADEGVIATVKELADKVGVGDEEETAVIVSDEGDDGGE